MNFKLLLKLPPDSVHRITQILFDCILTLFGIRVYSDSGCAECFGASSWKGIGFQNQCLDGAGLGLIDFLSRRLECTAENSTN
jgi:hypothetical protein